MIANNNLIEVRETVKANPANICIYCGLKEGLTDEHVIPLALGSLFVLPNSSCRKCSAITSSFEGKVLRGFMWNARTAGKFPTRRPKDRPKSLSLQIENNGVFEEIDVIPQNHPGFLHLPMLQPPSIVTGQKVGTGVTICGRETLFFGENPVKVAKNLKIKTMRDSSNWDVTAFGRMLAKIAYSYAIAVVGVIPLENVCVLPLILGTADDASVWLGSAKFQLEVEKQKPLHGIACSWVPHPSDENSILLLVHVKLFIPSGATGYEIVICQLPKSSNGKFTETILT